MRVLVVDDNWQIAELLSRMVQQVGHTTFIATDGLTAVRMALALPPDLVLLDIQMPGIDGYETARRLRIQHGRALPIFAVTSCEIDVTLADANGFSGWFEKPLGIDQLRALLCLPTCV